MPISIEGRIISINIKERVIFINTEIYLLDIENNAFFLINTGVEQITGEIIKFRKRKSDKKGETDSVLIYGNVFITFRIAVKYIYIVVVVFNIKFLDLLYQYSFNSVTNYLFETNIYR